MGICNAVGCLVGCTSSGQFNGWQRGIEVGLEERLRGASGAKGVDLEEGWELWWEEEMLQICCSKANNCLERQGQRG